MTLNMKVKSKGANSNKNWLSTLAKSPTVTDVVDSEATKAKRKAEVKVSGAFKTGMKFHWGSASLKGKWGNTVLIWPTTPMARKHPEMLRSAIRTTGFNLKAGKK